MINAQTIVQAKHREARCIIGSDPKDDTRLEYYFVVVDGEDDPIIGWGYDPIEAWDQAAKHLVRKNGPKFAYKVLLTPGIVRREAESNK